MKEIPLTRGYTALVDDADFPLVSQSRWQARPDRNTVYASRGVRDGSGKTKTLYMHVALLDAGDGLVVDHINGNGLDNRRKNLRIATRGQNVHHSFTTVKNKHGFRGISFIERYQRWQVSMKTGGRNTYVGFYATAEEAARAYDAKALEVYGEFARLNFPTEGQR